VGATSTVLHVAVESRHVDILHLLLTHLTSTYGTRTAVDGKGGLAQLVNAADRHGSTPAHVAAGMGSTVSEQHNPCGTPIVFYVSWCPILL